MLSFWSSSLVSHSKLLTSRPFIQKQKPKTNLVYAIYFLKKIQQKFLQMSFAKVRVIDVFEGEKLQS